MPKAWYCVITKPSQEGRAAYELRNQGFEVYLPFLKAKPMYPRYEFVRFDWESDPWGSIRSTRGCIGLLKHGFVPQAVRDPIISAIKAYEAHTALPEPDPVYERGQQIIVATGLLKGFEGLFDGTAHGRTMALLQIMGMKVEVPIGDIQAA